MSNNYMNAWDEYYAELLSSKQDEYVYGPASLKLTLTPIIRAYKLPLGKEDHWVCQHWQSMPRPVPPQNDTREYGWFIFKEGTLDYKTIPAEMIEIEEGAKIIPLQYRGKFIPGRNPVAVNYFPNSEIISQDGRFLLRKRRQ